jgi:hypothetical protein
MTRWIDKILEISGPALSGGEPILIAGSEDQADSLVADLASLLRGKNGFYALESALHVFPAQSAAGDLGLDRWNASECWRMAFDGMTEGCFFFAENVFGDQFALKRDGIYQFDAETADQQLLATDLETWAEVILADYEVLTGYPLGHQWQMRHGSIPQGKRLVPKRPFVLGGEFSVENLALLDAVQAMRFRGSIATQIRDLPDGAQIKIDMVE